MKFIWVALAFASLAWAGGHVAVSDYYGVWINADSDTREITRIEIRPQIKSAKGALVEMRIWSRCHPRDCDWGSNLGGYKSGRVNVEWEQGSDRVKQEFGLEPDGRLKVESATRFADRSGAQKHKSVIYFVRQPHTE